MPSDGETDGPIDPGRAELLSRLARAGREQRSAAAAWHAAVAARLGLGPSDEKVLELLERHGPLTAGDLVDRTGLAPASVTGVIDRLQARGFVRRSAHPSDRRRVVVEVGEGLWAQAAPLSEGLAASLDELYGGYDDDELALVLDVLIETARRLRDEAAGLVEAPGEAPGTGRRRRR